MKIKVINIGITTKTLSESNISDSFLVKENPKLLAQAVKVHQSKTHAATADTLDRSQVSGGGKKPWKQKGTGRARVGSSRSPLWRSGGVTFGPTRLNNFVLNLPKKMRQTAAKVAISEKVTNGLMFGLDCKDDAKRSDFLKAIHEHIEAGNRILLVTDNEPAIYKLTSNIPYIQNVGANSINAYDVMKNRYIVWSLKAMSEYFK